MIIDDRLKSLLKLAGVGLSKSDGSPKMVGQLIDELKAVAKVNPAYYWRILEKGIPLPRPRTYRNIWVVIGNAKHLSVEEPYGAVLTL